MSQIEMTSWEADWVTILEGLKCSRCYQILEDPVQFSSCLHIICLKCKQSLVGGTDLNIACPQCAKYNSKELASGQRIRCATSSCHDVAEWKCSECNQYVCSICRIDHHLSGHSISILKYDAALVDTIWEEARSDITFQGAEQIDSGNRDTIQCPICNGATCNHVELLQSLIAGLQGCNNHCRQQGHVDDNNQPRELKFFCHVCWTPICGDCSIGKHKLHERHETDDMSDCGTKFVVKAFQVLQAQLSMLIQRSSQDANDVKVIENQLQHHVKCTEEELQSRKKKIIEQTKSDFEKAIEAATFQGCSILTDYRENLHKIEKYLFFLQKLENALSNINTAMEHTATSQYAGAFSLQTLATALIQDLADNYQTLEKPEQCRLVLPEMEAIPAAPPHLGSIKTQWNHLKLAFSFKLQHHHSWASSIVLRGSDQCLLSVRRFRDEAKFDNIILCRRIEGKNKAEFKEYDVNSGTYHLSQLPSGEIVASYSNPNNIENKVLYFDGNLPKNNEIKFQVVAEFDFPPYGIATTNDNNIIICAQADTSEDQKMSSERKGLCQVLSMSLRGKLLDSILKQPDANLIRPDYVAVSDSGEICISDTENSSIVILHKNFKIKERVNYQLPTSVTNIAEYTFQPHGVCYDSVGRIIVADPNNNSVVRLVRAPQSHKYILEPLLSESSVADFNRPILVAMNRKDERLWVVCTGYVFVFDYDM